MCGVEIECVTYVVSLNVVAFSIFDWCIGKLTRHECTLNNIVLMYVFLCKEVSCGSYYVIVLVIEHMEV